MGDGWTGRPRAPDPAVFFLSDYGTVDEFVGVVHAVLHRLAPSVPVIDLTHQVPAYDIAAAAALLVRSGPHLGPGVVLAVVDPGVGTGRRGVALELAPGGPAWLVGPDNGLLVPLAASRGGVRSATALDPARLGAPSPPGTFDGRDVFAPAAAHLARGGAVTEIGTPVDPSTLAGAPERRPVGDRHRRRPPTTTEVMTSVTWVDRFGNAQLDLAPAALSAIGLAPGGTARITVERDVADGGRPDASHDPGAPRALSGLTARWVGGFGQLERGELGLLQDANGQVALVLDRDSAAAALGLSGSGAVVRIAGPPPPSPG